ncbi:MAG: hypothetical protein HOV81_03970 [Kofleriaceae bacterium]|nr:hypothetical protein [Kofleriaceae bacterium]
MRAYVLVGCAFFAFSCGGGSKPKTVKNPKPEEDSGQTAPKPETEADREAKRLAQAHAIIPEGSKCLPTSLKEEGAPRLELAASGADALLCAQDQDPSRLLGSVGCWKVDLATGGLEYREPQMLPGRGMMVKLDGQCARGYCLPAEAKVSGSEAHIAKNIDGTKVAVLVGDDVHIFNAENKSHESSFSIRGDKGVTNNPTAMHFVGDAIVVEGADEGPFSSVWVFKTDGTAVGPVTSLGGGDKQISTYKGSLSILDKTRIGVSERGMETLTTYQVDNGARAKLVRKVPKYSCKPAELDAYWHGGDKVTDKCKGSIEKASGNLMGATAVAGAKNFLVLLRGPRLGELGVLDSKSLAEKKAIKLQWCEGGAAADAGASEE